MTHAIHTIRRLLLLATLLVLIIPVGAAAETYYLRAAATTVYMPGVGAVPMWGYGLEADNDFTTIEGVVTVPGPELRVTDGTLTVHLLNDLPEPTSLIVRGQAMPLTGALPVEFSDGSRMRMRSVTSEAATGAQQTYSFTGLEPGTYLYQSGSHMSIQPAMGLYGAMVYDDGAYPGSAFDAEVTLLFSEIDLAQHQAVAGGTYGSAAYPTTMAVGYVTDYFLLNGQPYTAATTPSLTVTTGDRVLLRLLNAGLRDRVPVVPGVQMDLVAEDGNLFAQSYAQSTVNLSPSKTMDVLITAPAAAGYLPLFDRRLGLHDTSNSSYGMLTYLQINDAVPTTWPLAVDLVNANPGDRVYMSSSPGGIDCPGDCSEAALIDATGITLTAEAGPGSGLAAWRVFDGDPGAGGARIPDSCDGLAYCPLDMTAARWIEAEFKAYNTVTIIAPSANTVLTPGSLYMVRWAAPATAVAFDVSYNLGPGSPWISIADGIADLQAQWFIPAELDGRGNPRLMVAGYDATGAVDSSDTTVFKINLQDQITLIAPNGGETLVGDSPAVPFTIMWSQAVAASPVATVALQYQTAAGMPWQPIASFDPATLPTPGEYVWDVPQLASDTTDARVGILLYDDRGQVLVQDVSNAPFTINSTLDATIVGFAVVAGATEPAADVGPVLMLLPNGGEYIQVAGGFTVLWQADAAAVSFKLEISTDNGVNWIELATDLTDSQYDWQIAAELVGSQSLLRITAYDADGKSIGSDVSDEPFLLE